MRFGVPAGVLLSALALAGPGTAAAMDVGRPVFPPDSPWSAERTARYLPWEAKGELCYERYDRKMKVRVGGTSSDRDATLDVLGVKASFPVIRYATAYLEMGAFRNDDMDAEAPYFGAGAQFAPLRLYRFVFYSAVGARYLSSVEEYRASGASRTRSDEKWWEFVAGELVSIDLSVSDGLLLQPYAGAVLSFVDGRGHAEQASAESASTKSYRVEQDSPIVGVLGVSMLLGGQFSLRAEGRLGGDQSLTAAVGYAF